MDQQHQGTNIEVLEEILESLKITEEYALEKNWTIELETSKNMLTILVSAPATLE